MKSLPHTVLLALMSPKCSINDCQGHEHKDSRNKLTSVYVAQAFLTPKAPDFSCLLKNDYVAGKLSFKRDQSYAGGVNVTYDKAEQDGYNFKKAFGLGVSVEAYYGQRGDDCRRPLLPTLAAAVKTDFEIIPEYIVPKHFGCEYHTDQYDDGSYDNGGKQLFDFFYADGFYYDGQNYVNKTCADKSYHNASHGLIPFRRT